MIIKAIKISVNSTFVFYVVYIKKTETLSGLRIIPIYNQCYYGCRYVPSEPILPGAGLPGRLRT